MIKMIHQLKSAFSNLICPPILKKMEDFIVYFEKKQICNLKSHFVKKSTISSVFWRKTDKLKKKRTIFQCISEVKWQFSKKQENFLVYFWRKMTIFPKHRKIVYCIFEGKMTNFPKKEVNFLVYFRAKLWFPQKNRTIFYCILEGKWQFVQKTGRFSIVYWREK